MKKASNLRMKLLVTVSLLASLLAFTNISMAEAAKHDRKGNGHRIEKMLDHVDATDAQRSTIQTIVANFKPQLKDYRQQRREVKKQLRALAPNATNFDAEVNRLAQQNANIARSVTILKANMQRQIARQLTAEQRTIIKEHRAKRAAKMEERRVRKMQD